MPTNRTAVRRVSRRKIDAETLRLWKVIREITRGPRGLRRVRHREYIDLNCQLCTRLGIWWGFMIFPIKADRPEPPEYKRDNSLQAEVWRRAHRWRGLLTEAEAKS